MEPDCAGLLAVLRMDQIRFASPTAVLARPTGTPLSRLQSSKNRKAEESRSRRPKK